ncbi:hypothetical protein HDV02_004309 [Globomyces sp. JEL0801]|nr:hypothetical protein HDV02_004309 [Globomyces sp. JEL0801]
MTSPRLLRHPPTSSLSNKSLLGDQNYPWGYPQWLTTPTHLNPSPSSSVTIDHVPPDKAISPLSNNSRISLYDDTVEMEDTYVVEDKKNGIKANHPSNRKITMDKLLPKDIELIGCLGDSLFTDAFSKSHKSLEKTFVGDIVTALALIKTHLPNTFVCILPLPNLGQVLKDVGSEKRTKIISKIKLINQLLWDVTNDWDFNGDYYFRVTFQPIPFDDLDNPEFLNMYPLISTLDDQHPSFIAQQLFAKCIWNNLFLKPEHKITSIQQVIDSAWYEPTEDDYCQ